MSQTSSAGKTVSPTWLQQQGGIRAVGKGKEDVQIGEDATFTQKHANTQPTHASGKHFWNTQGKNPFTQSFSALSLSTSTPVLALRCKGNLRWVHQNEAKEDQRDHYLPLFSAVSIRVYHLEAQATPAAQHAGCPPFPHGESLAIARDLSTRKLGLELSPSSLRTRVPPV